MASFTRQLRALLILGRVSNLPTVWTNVAVGWYVAGGRTELELLWVLLGVSLLYVAGMTLNDAFDAKWDREHAPERPIPAGILPAFAVWLIGIKEMLLGILLLLFLTGFRPELLGGLVLSILLYDWLHKRWKGSVLIMGLCRALVYVGAATAAANGWGFPLFVLILGVAVVLYIAGLTLAARNERDESRQGTAFGVRLMLTLPVLFPLMASRDMDPGVLRAATIFVGITLIWAWVAVCRRTLSHSIGQGIAWLIAGIALYDAVVLVYFDWQAALAALGLFLLTLLLQRFIPAT